MGFVRLFQRLLDSRRTHEEFSGIKASSCRREQIHERCMSSTALFKFCGADPPATVSLKLPSPLMNALLTSYHQAVPAAMVITSLFQAITLMFRVRAATSTAFSSSNGRSVLIPSHHIDVSSPSSCHEHRIFQQQWSFRPYSEPSH